MKFCKSNLSLGLILISVPYLIERYISIPDFISGILRGVGIGLIISYLYKKSKEDKLRTSAKNNKKN